MLHPKLWSFVLAVAFAFVFGGEASASVVRGLTLEELIEEADCVAVGQVVHVGSVLNDDGTISTWSRVLVDELVRSGPEVGDEIVIETLGGQFGRVGMHVEGEPGFAVGERIVFFGRAVGYARFRPIGMAQGVFRTRTEGLVELVVPSRRGLLLLKRDKSGALREVTAEPPQPEPLQSFVSRIRALVEAQDARTDE